MKKLKPIVLVMALIALSACTVEAETDPASDSSLNIVTTTSMLTDLVETIGGEHVDVTGLMGPGVDPHDYQPSTSDVVAMGEADIVIYNGLSLEERFTEVFDQLGQRGVETIVAENALDEESVLLDPEESGSLSYDPHIWFSVSKWQEVTEHVADQLSQLDPDEAESYQQNAAEYMNELEDLQAYVTERVAEVPEESRYLVTAHDAFQYFGEAYDFEVVGLQGLNTQTEAGTGDISQMADFIVEQEIRAVFVESSVSPRSIEALIEAVGSRGYEISNAGELYSDALGSPEDNADTYITMYQSNIDTIVDALTD